MFIQQYFFFIRLFFFFAIYPQQNALLCTLQEATTANTPTTTATLGLIPNSLALSLSNATAAKAAAALVPQ